MSTKPPLLHAAALTRRFGGLAAVDAVSLDVHLREIHAIIGTNGAGKSTLVAMLSGELAPSTGALHMNGADITGWGQARRARAGIGRSFQRTTIFPAFTLLENCRLAAQGASQRPLRLWESAGACKRSLDSAWRALEAAGLHARAQARAGEVSHGQQRQLEIAMCLATEPVVLLLDEPLAGMGAEETERMLGLLERLRGEHAIVLVEHDMDAVFRVADRVTVMVNGKVIASGGPEQIRNDPAVKTAYLGEQHAAH
jgi:branched-chain amino acid transport system ATP-binding protein